MVEQQPLTVVTWLELIQHSCSMTSVCEAISELFEAVASNHVLITGVDW